MSEPKEITVKIKDVERTLSHKFLVYDDMECSSDDPVIKNCIDEAKKDFKGEAESVKVIITIEVV